MHFADDELTALELMDALTVSALSGTNVDPDVPTASGGSKSPSYRSSRARRKSAMNRAGASAASAEASASRASASLSTGFATDLPPVDPLLQTLAPPRGSSGTTSSRLSLDGVLLPTHSGEVGADRASRVFAVPPSATLSDAAKRANLMHNVNKVGRAEMLVNNLNKKRGIEEDDG